MKPPPLRFDPDAGTLVGDGTEVILPPRASAVLRILLERPGEVVTKEALLESVWNDVVVEEQSVSEAIGILRRALDDDPQKPRYIQTVHRRGYRFIGPLGTRAGAAQGRSWSSFQAKLAVAGSLLAALAVWLLIATRRPTPLPTVELVSSGGDVRAVSLSPDGRELASVSESGDVVVLELESRRERAVARTNPRIWMDSPPAWSPDGRSLAYGFLESRDPIAYQIRIVSSRGGDPKPVHRSSNGQAIVCDWAPGGGALLVLRERGESHVLRELALRSGAEEVLAEFAASFPYRARYSPDGTRIAYGALEGGKGVLYVMRRDTRARRRLSHEWASEFAPVWSPDGSLLYRCQRGSSWDFWGVALDDRKVAGGPFLVKADVGRGAELWSASRGGSLVFSEPLRAATLYRLPIDRDDLAPAVYSASLSGVVSHGIPSRKGDGAVVATMGGEGRRFHLVSPLGARPLAVPVEYGLKTAIGWGSDDRWVLLWGRNEHGEDQLVRVFLEGGIERIALEAGPPLLGELAALSPDGALAALEEERDADERQIVILDVESGSRRRIEVTGRRLMPSFSPDGERLAVARNLEDGRSDVVIVSLGDGAALPIASWGPEAGSLGSISWGSRGERLVYVLRPPDGPNELHVLSIPDGSSKPLFVPRAGMPMPSRPSWASDGKSLVFTGLTWETQIQMMTPSQGSVTTSWKGMWKFPSS